MAPILTIDIDAETAELVEKRATDAGLTPAQLIASLLRDDDAAELQRRWTAIVEGEATVPHGEVELWLRSWGTPDYKPWAERE